MNYGEKIAALRKAKGITQEELGKELNVTYQAVSKWERGESLPDFATMSHIAKYFEVSIGYFEDGGETKNETPVNNAHSNIIGNCTVCGRALKEGEETILNSKLVCKPCAERQANETAARIKSQEDAARRQEEAVRRREEYNREVSRGSGINATLIISVILGIVGYIVFTVLCFTCKPDERELYALLAMLVPLALFACITVVIDFINELRDRGDDSEGYKRNLSLLVGGLFSLLNIAVNLILYFSFGNQPYYLVLLGIGAVISFTFVSQFAWGSIIREFFTCGGFTFKLPGFIFSLTVESILWMIVTKIILGIISVLIFILTTILFALIAIFGSVFTFIPCIISKTVKDAKA